MAGGVKMWRPFKPKLETRDQDYTDVVVQSLLAAASGDVAQGLVAGTEIAAGHWQRAFSAARVQPAGVLPDALTPWLGYIGRQLVTDGEAIFALDFGPDGLALIPASNATISGGPNPASWTYELTLSGPSSTHTQRPLRSDAVLHLFYARGAKNPWRGISPIEASQTTQKLLDNLEHRLAQEAGAAAGHVILVPQVETTAQLQTDLRAMDGRTTLVETTALGWDAGEESAPPQDFRPARLGANPPPSLVTLRREAEQSVLAACGVPMSVLSGSTANAARELYRQFLHGVIQPTADSVAAQINAHFETELSFDFSRLFAADLSGRARAFQSMVGGGMPIEKAAALAGLMEPDE